MSIKIGRQIRPRQVIENPFRQTSNLMCVRFFVSKAATDGLNAAQSIVGNVGTRWLGLSLDLAQAIDQDSLA